MVQRNKLLCLASLLLLCSWCALADPLLLRVDGTNLVYGGTNIMLRGVAVGDPILAREGRPLSDFGVIATNWNANAVRLDIHPSVWKHQDHETVLAELERQVNAARQAGLFVIIDWHTIGWPNGYYEKGEPGDESDLYDSSVRLATSFWDAVSRRFGSDPGVLFELWNEPVYSAHEADSPGLPQRWVKLKMYWLDLTDVIRAHSRNVILAAGSQWAYNLRGVRGSRLPDHNTAYVWHIYAGHDDNDEAQWNAALDDLQTVCPVVVTEWGFQRDTKDHFKGTPENFGAKFARDFLDGKQLHSTAWCWHPEWTPNLLKDDWRTPTEFGQFVLDYLKSHPAQRP